MHIYSRKTNGPFWKHDYVKGWGKWEEYEGKGRERRGKEKKREELKGRERK